MTNPQNATRITIEVDQGNEGINTDSAYHDSSYESETTSVSSSIFSYVYENGRRYHSDRYSKAEYFLPNDDVEQDRLDLFHHISTLHLKGKLHMAPLESPQKILDVGTGTGIWAIEMAYDNPQAQVIGVDISPIQPNMVPQNCVFEVDDMEEETWTYKSNEFDFIHMRALGGSFQNWDSLLRNAYEHLAPGGFLEFQDHGSQAYFHTGESTTGHDTPAAQMVDLMNEAANNLGRTMQIAHTIKDRMIEVGFVDVVEKVLIWPVGDWPKDKELKELGKWGKLGSLESVETFAVSLFTRGLGWDAGKAKDFCEEVKKDLGKGSKNKYYWQLWVVYGMKPR